MSDIFAIRKNIPKYQILDLDILDITRNLPDNIDLDSVYEFCQQNISMAQWWEKPDTKYISVTSNGKSLTPDISCWIDATLTLSPKAYRLLRDLLADSGEFLPVSIAGETHYIFNCFIFGKEDKQACQFNEEEGMQAGLKHLEFQKSTSDLLMFKSELEGCLTLFCNARFKEIVESFELSGVVFDENLIIA